jgi:hypothetical protein
MTRCALYTGEVYQNGRKMSRREKTEWKMENGKWRMHNELGRSVVMEKKA